MCTNPCPFLMWVYFDYNGYTLIMAGYVVQEDCVYTGKMEKFYRFFCMWHFCSLCWTYKLSSWSWLRIPFINLNWRCRYSRDCLKQSPRSMQTWETRALLSNDLRKCRPDELGGYKGIWVLQYPVVWPSRFLWYNSECMSGNYSMIVGTPYACLPPSHWRARSRWLK